MCMLSLKPFHTMKTLGKGDDWEKFRVSIKLPLSDGWYENVQLHIIENGSFNLNGTTCNINHKENDESYAIFESDITLQVSALYYYYISYKCNGVKNLMKKEEVSQIQSITKQECFKISANFSAPEWAKGAIMYQIFTDRFYRDQAVKTPEKGTVGT